MASGSSLSGSFHHEPTVPTSSKQPGNQHEESEKKSVKTCGLGSCQPAWLQPMARPAVYLLCISLTVFTQGLLVSGFTNSIISTIERRYNLRSTESGFIVSSYDITCTLAVILVSYYGDRHSRAKWIGRSVCIMALGSILFSLPHFIGANYKYRQALNATEMNMNLCNSTRNHEAQTSKKTELDCSVGNSKRWVYALFVIANMVIGIGTSTIYTLGPTYLYDNVKREVYAVYSATMYSMTALGPAVGFLLGAFFLTLYVDLGSEHPGIDKDAPEWIGAWWLGFLLSALLGLLIALPLMLFPKELPTKVKKAEVAGELDSLPAYGTDIKGLPVKVWGLLTNKPWLFVSLALVMEQSITTGFVTFIAKYFEVTYGVTAMKANVITGAVIIPGAFLGIILGGCLMKKLSLDLYGISKVLLVSSLVPTLAVTILLFLGCQNVQLVGISSQSGPPKEEVGVLRMDTTENLTLACDNLCECSQTMYEPVCGHDRQTYFSPCHAGCTDSNVHTTPGGATVKNYSSCACIYEGFLQQAAASTGKCDNGCAKLIPFLVILFILVFITCLGHNPVLLITLGSVDSGSRSFGLGMQNVLLRLLAFIPAPIYFGRIFDSACILFAPSCDKTGACLEYDTTKLPIIFFGTCLALKGIAYFFLILTVISLRSKRSKSSYSVDSKDYSVSCSTVATTPDTEISTVCTAYSQQGSDTQSYI